MEITLPIIIIKSIITIVLFGISAFLLMSVSKAKESEKISSGAAFLYLMFFHLVGASYVLYVILSYLYGLFT